MNIYGEEIKMDAMDMSETYQAAASIQLRTHPTHSAINFSELGKKLLESARNGDTDEVLELINGGAPFTTDWLGASPLHYAAQYGHVDTVEALLRSGIAKDARTKIERTALHVAAQEGHYETVNVLVNFGADVDSKDMLKMTPLHWAVQRGYRDIMEVLLNSGADVNIANKFEKTPIEIAYSTGRHDIVPLLQSFKGKAKPKLNPIETATPVRLLKNSNTKRVNKTPNINRSFNTNVKIKQEIVDDMDIVTPTNEFNGKINKTQKEKDLLQNVLSNGQTIGFTEAGKMVFNSVKPPQQQQSSSASSNSNGNNVNSNAKKLVIYQNQPNIVLVQSNSNQQSGKSSEAKVVKKTPIITDLKNAKTIQVDKLPFFGKPGQGQVIKRYVINPTQTEDVKKLNEEIKNLKKELEDYKSLIISKDLEIERLKKRIDNCDN